MIHILEMRHLPREVLFLRTAKGSEPVREWLKSLSKEEQRIIGEDIKVVQGTLRPKNVNRNRKYGVRTWSQVGF